MRENKKGIVLGLVVSIVFIILLSGVVLAVPYGATLTENNSTRPIADYPNNRSAIAGNVTEITITGYSTTQGWQGYYGNVSGTIQLADSADNVMYNWSYLSPKGEIYASRNDTINWFLVQCFNYTAEGTFNDDAAQAGKTSLFGMNETQLEESYGFVEDDPDRVNNTFVYNNHPKFYTNNLQFDPGECINMKVFNSSGLGAFDEVLLYEPTGKSVIFTSILQQDGDGFNQKTHDFEMLVLENGHGTDLDTTTYYFYVELG